VRALWLFALAACGRLEFGRERVTDGAPGDAPLDPSLVAWWRMEGYVGEGEAMGIADSTGVTNSFATCSGTTCPAIVPGKLGNAVSFDGVDGLLEAASMSSLVDGEFTVGAWIEMTRATTGENVQCAYGKASARASTTRGRRACSPISPPTSIRARRRCRTSSTRRRR
jgi:hypothetical protein